MESAGPEGVQYKGNKDGLLHGLGLPGGFSGW